MIILREAGAGDDEARAALYRECFGYPAPAGLFEWKYRRNPHGRAIELVACEEGGAVVGAYALVPRWFSLAGEGVLALQAADAMTTAGWRGRGIFGRLQDEARRRADERGAAFLFAFAGRRSAHLFEGEGYFALAPLEELERRVRRWRRRPRGCAPWVLAGELGALPAAGEVSGRRDQAFIAWRAQQTPTGRHRCWRHGAEERWAITEECGSQVVLADLWPPEPWCSSAQPWRELAAFLEARGAQRLRLSLFHGEACWKHARAVGFRRRRAGSALPFMVHALTLEADALRAAFDGGFWIRDLDRDAEGLLLRAAMGGEQA